MVDRGGGPGGEFRCGLSVWEPEPPDSSEGSCGAYRAGGGSAGPGDCPGGWQVPVVSAHARRQPEFAVQPDCVSVDGRQEAQEGREGGAPLRLAQVVTGAVGSSGTKDRNLNRSLN